MKKHKSIRWTKVQAESEFKVSEEKLTKRLKAAGIIPGDDGFFSTHQICQALFNDEHVEKINLLKEQIEDRKIRNAEARKELIPVEELKSRMEKPILAMRQLVLSETQLTPEAKEEILLNLQELLCSAFGGKVTQPKARKALAKTKE